MAAGCAVWTMRVSRLISRILSIATIVLLLPLSAHAEWKEKVLYSFQGVRDGAVPVGRNVFDKAGNLYGATEDGGASTCDGPGQCGTVYQLKPPAQKGGAWKETVLYVFKGHAYNDGATPEGGLVIDPAGSLYGSTGYGGSGPCTLLGGAVGCGTVYRLSPPAKQGDSWKETVLYSFQGGKDGFVPSGDLVFDKAGNLYGATLFGGGKGTTCDSLYGGQCGTVFRLSPPKTKGGKWTERVLHGFAGIATGKRYGDGAVPNGGLVLDSFGVVYGTTFNGGYNCPHNSNQGCGTAFQVRPPTNAGGTWDKRLLHRFTDGSDGAGPNGGLVLGPKGMIYGTTGGGGRFLDGVVFRLVPRTDGLWTEAVLYTFTGGSDGDGPGCCLLLDGASNLYGTAFGGLPGRGTVYRLEPRTGGGEWAFSLIYAFTGAPDGAYPTSGLIFDNGATMYSTTQGGGDGQACQGGCGTVFEVSP